MNKTKFKYVKYTKQELDRYVRDKNSCVALINGEMHIGFPPWGFANFQETLINIISRDKIGKYDTTLSGIVLEFRNIKVIGTAYPVHNDDPYNHINIKANFYVFQPRIGATIKGIVKHISHGHVAVIIYRVFNVSIRFNKSTVQNSLKINQQISFRIKNFDLQGAMPYIEGEYREENIKQKTNNIKAEKDANSDPDSDSSSSSDSELTPRKSSQGILLNGAISNIKIKKEKISDSEAGLENGIAANNIKTENNASSSESDDSMDHARIKIKREKQTNELPSTVKIKEEPQSEDETVKRKKIKKSNGNYKSLKSIESDLFDSFLK